MSQPPPPGGQPQPSHPTPQRPSKKGPATVTILLIVLGIMLCGGIGIISILATIAVPNFLEAQTRSRVSRARADLRSLATAIEAYYVDNNSYPVHQFDETLGGARYAFAPHKGTFQTLTTPIGYITSIWPDPFATGQETTYSYFSTGKTWIVWSFGPDRDDDIGPFLSGARFDLSELEEALVSYTYDPTNGTISDGDIVRMKR